jgi:hypothetical protein
MKEQNYILYIQRYFFFVEEIVMLRTMNYRKHKVNVSIHIPMLHGGSFETQSTASNDHHLFYSDIEKLRVSITKKMPVVTWSSARFQQIKSLIVEVPIIRSSLWNKLSNMGKKNIKSYTDAIDSSMCLFALVNFSKTNNNDVAQQSVPYLLPFVELSHVTEIEFGSTFDISRWKDVQFILQ